MKSILRIAILLQLVFTLIFFDARAQLTGFALTGNPESTNGATWTYSATVNSIVYNLKGLLYKPVGTGTFAAVIINHGTGGNTAPGGYSDLVAKEMVNWGYVCIATNACHMGTNMSYPCGSPGACDTSQWGARTNNFLRTMKVWDILASLGYVDTNCIATFGHSRGSFLTTGLAGTYPYKFSCAGHTAGGLAIPDSSSLPTSLMANNVTIPYIMHHGTADVNVPLYWDNNLDAVFTANSVTHQYWTYTGYTHAQIPQDPLMYVRTKAFFNQYICSPSIGIKENFLHSRKLVVSPNPASNTIKVHLNQPTIISIQDIFGRTLFENSINSDQSIDISFLPSGIYYVSQKDRETIIPTKIIVDK